MSDFDIMDNDLSENPDSHEEEDMQEQPAEESAAEIPSPHEIPSAEYPTTEQPYFVSPVQDTPVSEAPAPEQNPFETYAAENPAQTYNEQPYRPEGRAYPVHPQQPYEQNRAASQPSQGYYRPYSNEYVYSPQPPKKKGNAGKALLITIACLLSVFVVSVASISAYNYFTTPSGNPFGMIQAGQSGKKKDVKLDDYHNDADDTVIDDDNVDAANTDNDADEEVRNNLVTSPTQIRDFPTLEQLAAPDDAMSIPDIYDKVSPSVVGVSCTVRGGIQTGTGFIISEDGYIVTNAHVIEDYVSVMIVDGDMNEYEAEVIGSDTQTDIAVLRIDPDGKDLVPVEFGKSGELRIGELAIAIGNPLGFDLYGTMTTGIISGLDRSVTVGDNTMNLLQTSASINSGNSGGPLIDAYGRVIGITSAKVNSLYGESLGFAIPIDEALPIVENLIRYGYVLGRPSIGISGQDITEILSLYYRMPQGVYVFAVSPGSGAEAAGMLAGDIIIGIQGETIKNMDELNAIKNQYAVGDTVTLTIYRGGQNFDVEVTLTESTPNS